MLKKITTNPGVIFIIIAGFLCFLLFGAVYILYNKNHSKYSHSKKNITTKQNFEQRTKKNQENNLQKNKESASKTNFIEKILPIIRTENKKIETLRKKIINLKDKPNLSKNTKKWLRKIAVKYQVKYDTDKNTIIQLLNKIDIIPTSIVLAQAVNESGWGKSRFAVYGNNLFGVWCYTKDCGLVPKKRPANKTYEVKKYPSINESIEDYMLNINSHNAYAAFRKSRQELREKNLPLTGKKLVEDLSNYAEIGDLYTKIIKSIILKNKFYLYDN